MKEQTKRTRGRPPKPPGEKFASFTVVMPQKLCEQLTQIAAQERRSRSSQIVILVEKALSS